MLRNVPLAANPKRAMLITIKERWFHWLMEKTLVRSTSKAREEKHSKNTALRIIDNHQEGILLCNSSRVQRFRGSRFHFRFRTAFGTCIYEKKSSSTGLIQNLEPNWQLLEKMTMFNEDFGYSMPSLPLTLNVEP